MGRAKPKRKQEVRCQGCKRITPSYDIVSYGSPEDGFRELCGQCVNTEVAKANGLEDFEDVRFEPMKIADSTGKEHEFHFRTRLFGPGVALEGLELRGGEASGYEFQIIGDPKDDLMVLLGRLIEKIRRGLSSQHLMDGEYGLQIAEDMVVRGRVGWDAGTTGCAPILVIDGREISWEQFGRMLMTFEGWQFKLEIRDMSEEA